MEASNQNNITYTVADGQKALTDQMAKTKKDIAMVKSKETSGNNFEVAKMLKELDDYYNMLFTLREKRREAANIAHRAEKAREALPTQPLEIKTRWFQHQANIFAKDPLDYH